MLNKALLALSITLLLGCGNSRKATEDSKSVDRKSFKHYFHQGNSEKMIGHNERAIELFEQCLVIEAENHAVHFALSDLYEAEGDAEKTLFHAEKAYALNNNNKWYALRLADLYFEAENFSKTADLYGQIIEDEKNIDIKFKYTDALIRSKRFEEAINMLDEISVETGKIPEISFTKFDLLMQLGKTEEAQLELVSLIEENPGNSDIKISVAEFYMQQNQFEKSNSIIQSILEDDPDYGQAYIMLADLDLRQDNVTGAFVNLEKGFSSDDVELDRKLEILRGLIPYTAKNQRDFAEMRIGVQSLFDLIYAPELRNNKLHSYYGHFMVTSKNLEKAEREYQLACDIDASSFNAWLQLLSVQNDLDHHSGMLENGKKAIALFPSQPIIYLLTGIGAKESEKYEEAEEWFFLGKDLVVKDIQLQSEFLYQLGDMNYRQNNSDEGAFYFKQALEVFNGNVNVYVHKAKRLMEAEQLNEAEAEIKKGIEIVPKNAQLFDLYGQILFEKKEYENAAEAFVNALYEDYFDGNVLEHYGDALFLSGEKDKAIELWEEAIKYGNDSEVLNRKLVDKTYYAPE